MQKHGFLITAAKHLSDVFERANLIVTTTSASTPVVETSKIYPGTLLISVGSDTTTKQEIAPQVLKLADRIIADSKEAV